MNREQSSKGRPLDAVKEETGCEWIGTVLKFGSPYPDLYVQTNGLTVLASILPPIDVIEQEVNDQIRLNQISHSVGR